jgi:anthranilate synthase component 1
MTGSVREAQTANTRDFLTLARRHDAVPLVRSFLADLTTPLGAFLRLRSRSGGAFLLESVEGGERVSRYSFTGSGPASVLLARGARVTERDAGGVRETGGTFLAAARERLRPLSLPPLSGLPPFLGGAVGWLGYGCARWFEPVLGEELRAGDDVPDAALLFFRTVVAFDHARRLVHVASLVPTTDAQSDAELLARRDAAREELDATERALTAPLPDGPWAEAPRDLAGEPAEGAEARSIPDRAGFLAGVARAKAHIRAGDAFQVVLSRRLEVPLGAEPVQVYRALRTVDPAPYLFLLELDGLAVLGASPETLVRCEGRRLWYRPIAGTRPRGATDEEDLALEAELLADPKERAEHVMLVDLGRNDLGRVASPGSVRVDALLEVERYSHVMHLVSRLSAELRDGLDRFDALAACFPAGTVTGAPKIRAMQILDELEPQPRGVYGGAVLYADHAGVLDACIAIRTLVARDGRAVLQAGAGLVADSVPEREFEETQAKAGALLRAIRLAEGWAAAGPPGGAA